MTVMVNGSVKAKRGVYKAFRDYLNAKYSQRDLGTQTDAIGKWRMGDRNQFGNRTRQYGDWLYFQDRSMFDELLSRTLEGRTEEEFNAGVWLA